MKEVHEERKDVKEGSTRRKEGKRGEKERTMCIIHTQGGERENEREITHVPYAQEEEERKEGSKRKKRW